MSTDDAIEEAVDVLQELDLKEYEAKCFAGLSQLSTGTAKELSEVTDVPRTRVYDAIRVLEAQGLVEIQHSTPQRFRAVPIEEATETLRDRYDSRVQRLADALDRAEQLQPDDDRSIQEVWAMSGGDGIENRTNQLIAEARDEIVLVIGDDSLLTAELVETLNAVDEADLILGTVSEPLEHRVQDAVNGAETFVSGLEWLQSKDEDEPETAIGRLLIADRSTILVSTLTPRTGEEQAVFGGGFKNGLVVIARRLMSKGLIPTRDSGES